MKTRKYIVRQIDAGDNRIIAEGDALFFTNDEELVPDGFLLDYVRNTPTVKNIYVTTA